MTFGSHASAISLTYIPLVSPLAPKTCDNEYWEQKRSNLPEGWETRISWETSTPGMVLRTVMPNYKPPPGLHWLPRVGANGNLYQAQGPPGTGGEQGGTGGGPEQEQAPMAFLRRYWYILLPLFIMNFFGAPEAPPAEGQSGQAAGGGAAPAGGAAAPAAAPAAGASPPKSRRGKRG